MSQFSRLRIPFVAALLLIGFTLFSTTVRAQTKVEGLIQARSGDTMIMQTSDSPKLVVLLTDSTDVAQVQGVLKARKKEMSMAALIPGLAVKVEGTYNDQEQAGSSNQSGSRAMICNRPKPLTPACMKLRHKFSRTKRNWKSKKQP